MSETQLHKILTNPRNGQRLGTSAATWNKLKSAAADSWDKSSYNGNNDEDTPNIMHSSPKQYAPSNLVENGPNGEVCIWYEEDKTYEIWGWESVASYSAHEEDGATETFNFHQASNVSRDTATRDCLSLLSKFVTPGRSVMSIKIMAAEEGPVFISAFSYKGRSFLEARCPFAVHKVQLPEHLQNDHLILKVSQKFLVIASSKGLLHVLKYSGNKESLFVEANVDGTLNSIYNHCTRPLITRYKIKDTSSKTILLKAGTFDESAIFDIVGTWLVYCPKKVETEYFKNLMHSADDSFTKGSKGSRGPAKKLYTSVKLPPNGPILLRAASSLANSAIDKLFKLSQVGSQKVKTYWNPEKSLFDKDISLHTISSSIGNALYSTASKIKSQAGMMGENEIIKVIDLCNGQTMATFKPPGGISHLSLSQYDLQLAQTTYRGDNFYVWDLYKLPKEVSFVGKFSRGKTSAVVKEVFWFVNDKTVEGSKVTNSGFGCITKKTGSIHWYNINYLFCANENDNYPNAMEVSSSTIPKHGQFLDSWILPSMNAVKLLKLPSVSNIPDGSGIKGVGENDPNLNLWRSNQLAFIDSEFNLRLLSPWNGKHTFKYKLNKKPVGNVPAPTGTTYETWYPFHHTEGRYSNSHADFDTPLSQMEIETCVPFASLIADKNILISSYDLKSAETKQSFWDHFSTFGNEVPSIAHAFDATVDFDTPSTSVDDLVEQLNHGLLIHPDDEEIIEK